MKRHDFSRDLLEMVSAHRRAFMPISITVILAIGVALCVLLLD